MEPDDESPSPDVDSPQKATAVALGEKVKRRAPPPRDTSVIVLNGNGIEGSASTANYLLSQRGYKTVLPPDGLPANAPSFDFFRTTIYFDSKAAGAKAAAQKLANLFGSVMIFIDKPFQIGDTIVLNGMEGTVEEVGFRTSRVRTAYDSQVTVPNGLVVNAMIDNHGRRKYRRYKTLLGLTYDTPPEKVQAFCEGVRAILAAAPATRKDLYRVEFIQFGACALEIEVTCFFAVTSTDDGR